MHAHSAFIEQTAMYKEANSFTPSIIDRGLNIAKKIALPIIADINIKTYATPQAKAESNNHTTGNELVDPYQLYGTDYFASINDENELKAAAYKVISRDDQS